MLLFDKLLHHHVFLLLLFCRYADPPRSLYNYSTWIPLGQPAIVRPDGCSLFFEPTSRTISTDTGMFILLHPRLCVCVCWTLQFIARFALDYQPIVIVYKPIALQLPCAGFPLLILVVSLRNMYCCSGCVCWRNRQIHWRKSHPGSPSCACHCFVANSRRQRSSHCYNERRGQGEKKGEERGSACMCVCVCVTVYVWLCVWLCVCMSIALLDMHAVRSLL